MAFSVGSPHTLTCTHTHTLTLTLTLTLTHSLTHAAGLGDTNYNNFCNMGKNLHRRLLEVGATPFVEPDWADDGVG